MNDLPISSLARAILLLALALPGCCLSVEAEGISGSTGSAQSNAGQTSGQGTSGQGSGGQASTGGTTVDCESGVFPNVLDFGPTLINTVVKRSVTLRNCSTAPLTGLTATIAGGDANLFMVDDVPMSLEPGDSAAVNISYDPLALETRSVANVTFEGSDAEKATLTLFGEPIACALTLAPNPIDFGFVEPRSSGIACTTLTNQCTVAVTVSRVDFSIPDGPFGLSETDGVSLPVTISGGEGAKICFSYTAPDSGQLPSETVTFVLEGWSGGNLSMTL